MDTWPECVTIIGVILILAGCTCVTHYCDYKKEESINKYKAIQAFYQIDIPSCK